MSETFHLNDFSSLIEVMIAFNVAFIIGNNFAEKVCNNFYFNKNLIHVELKMLKTSIDSLINTYREDLQNSIPSKIIDIKAKYYLSKHEQCITQLDQVNQLTIKDINVYSFVNMVYAIILLILIPLEEVYEFKVLFFTSTLTLTLFVWEIIVFTVHIQNNLEKLNSIFRNPIKSLWIILPTILICTIIMFKFLFIVDYIVPILLSNKGVTYIFILSLPALHFIPFLIKIWYLINTNETAVKTSIKSLMDEIKSESNQVTNISAQISAINII